MRFGVSSRASATMPIRAAIASVEPVSSALIRTGVRPSLSVLLLVLLHFVTHPSDF
jgi:hypothetical protein